MPSTRATLNIATILVNDLLDLPEPRRTELIAATMRSGDPAVVAVLKTFIDLLPADLRAIDTPTNATEQVRTFLLDRCDVKAYASGVTGASLYEEYSLWCDARGIVPMSGTTFGREAGRLTTKRATRRGIVYPQLRIKCE